MAEQGVRKVSGAVVGLLVLAGLGIGIGCLLGLVPSGQCGSPWSPDANAAEVSQMTSSMSGLPDTFAADCAVRFGARGGIGGGIAGFGGAAGLAAVVVRGQDRRRVA